MIVDKLFPDTPWFRETPRHGIIRMSQVEGCPRALGLSYLGYEPDFPESSRSSRVLDDGTIHEKDIVDRLINYGFDIWNFMDDQTTVHRRSRGVHYVGHPDILGKYQDRPLGFELKGFRTERFAKYLEGAVEIADGAFSNENLEPLMRRPWPLMGQVQSYLNSETSQQMGIEEWIVIIKDKNTSEFVEFVVPKLPDYLDALDRKWYSFWSLMSVERVPKHFFEQDSMECSRCEYRKTCWGLVQGFKKESITLDTLEQAASWRRRGLELEKEADLLLSSARHEFLMAAIDNEVDQVIGSGLKATVSYRKSKRLDTRAVEGYLKLHVTPEEMEGFYNVTEYPEVRFSKVKDGRDL
jgi:hypothetical protein